MKTKFNGISLPKLREKYTSTQSKNEQDKLRLEIINRVTSEDQTYQSDIADLEKALIKMGFRQQKNQLNTSRRKTIVVLKMNLWIKASLTTTYKSMNTK